MKAKPSEKSWINFGSNFIKVENKKARNILEKGV